MQFISNEQVREFDLSPEFILPIVKSVLSAIKSGDIVIAPRPTIESRNGSRFMAFPVIIEDLGMAGVKWLGTTNGPATGGRGGSVIVLNEIASGKPFAVVDAAWITAVRTATVSLFAALIMASSDSRKIAFVGCGEQARLHLEYFARHFDLKAVSAFSRTMESASRFAQSAQQAFGIHGSAHASLRECVSDADIVISTTPSPSRELLKAEWLKENCFCSLVDLGRSFETNSMPSDRMFVVDDLAQFADLTRAGKLPVFSRVDPTTLVAISESPKGHVSRTGGFLMPTGLGAVDVSIACAIFNRQRTNHS